MAHVTIYLSDEVNKELAIFAAQETRSKSNIARMAINKYLAELREDREDGEIALSRENDIVYSSEEAERYLRVRLSTNS